MDDLYNNNNNNNQKLLLPPSSTSSYNSQKLLSEQEEEEQTLNMLESSPLIQHRDALVESNHHHHQEQEQSNKRSDLSCYLYMLGAAIFFWIMNAAAKELGISHHLAASEIGFIRSLISLPASILIIVGIRASSNTTTTTTTLTILGPKSVWVHGWMRGLFAFGALVCTFFTVSKLPLGDAIILSFTSPVWSIFMGFLILKEKIRNIDLLITVLSLTGCALVTHPQVIFFPSPSQQSADDKNFSMSIIVIGIGLLGALCQSLSFITVRQIMIFAKPHPMQLLLHLSIISLPLGFLFALIEGKAWILPSNWQAWLLIIAVGAGGVIGQVCLAVGLGGRAGVAGANNIMYFQVIFAYISDILLWNNLPNMDSTIGAALVFSCGIIGFVSARYQLKPVLHHHQVQEDTSRQEENAIDIRQDNDQVVENHKNIKASSSP